MTELGPFYDRQGNAIDWFEYTRLDRDRAYKVVRQTQVDDVVVSTVWLGLDHGFGFYDEPLIFETMLMSRDLFPRVVGEGVWLGAEFEDFQERYSSEDVAIERHEEIVTMLRVKVPNAP